MQDPLFELCSVGAASQRSRDRESPGALAVQHVRALLASGATIEEILDEYQGLEREDILACLQFASETLESTSFLPLAPSAK